MRTDDDVEPICMNMQEMDDYDNAEMALREVIG